MMAVGGLALWCSAAQAQWFARPFNVPSGGSVKIGFYASVNPDCSDAGAWTFRVTQPPRNGRVVVERARDFVYFQPSNPRSACNQRRVQGLKIRYVAQRGYTGDDSFSGELFSPRGGHGSGTVYIRVR